MSEHKQIQSGGVCWDCGAMDARASAEWSRVDGQPYGVKWAGWICSCGRRWAVLPGDVRRWATALAGCFARPVGPKDDR